MQQLGGIWVWGWLLQAPSSSPSERQDPWGSTAGFQGAPFPCHQRPAKPRVQLWEPQGGEEEAATCGRLSHIHLKGITGARR